MTAVAMAVGMCLGLCTSLRRIAGRRRPATPVVVAVPVRVQVREPEPFWFPAPPAFTLDHGSEVLAHVSPAYPGDIGEVLEFPVGKGWDVHAIATVLAEIESL